MLPRPDTTTATAKRIARKYKRSALTDPNRFLHIRCGDDILSKLDAAGIPGDKIRWTDPLCEGPLPGASGDAARQRRRAGYLGTRYQVPMTETYRELRGQDWRVDQCVRYRHTVLWFEADLYDQSILVYLLARLYPLLAPGQLELICIESFPGIPRFVGLGQLTPPQLASLFPRRKPVTKSQFELATAAWHAFNAPTPAALSRLGRPTSRVLPYLPAAIRRYLAEYPSVENGLGKTEQWALEAIDRDARNTGAAFRRVQQRERRPFMGDAMFFSVLRTLASGKRPAVAGAHRRMDRLTDRQMLDCPCWLTDTGKRLLAGTLDWRELLGEHRWMGGVLLEGPTPRWRWNGRRIVEAVTASSPMQVSGPPPPKGRR